LSYQRAKRELAANLGVDPYSSNEQLQNLLNTVAAHRNAGALAGRVGSAFIPGGAGIFIRAAQMNKNLQSKIRDMSAPELQKANAATLRKLGCDEGHIRNFLSMKGYTATRCTAITDCLDGLSGMQGMSQYLAFVRPASNPEVSLYYETQAQMARAYHLTNQRLRRFDVKADTAVFTAQDGSKHVFAPVDRLMWTSSLSKRIRGISGDSKIELWITGSATERAKTQLSKHGVTLHENSGEKLFAAIN
jgi:hypothetical protein